MCGRVIIVPKEELEQIVQDIIRRRTVEYLPDWPAVRHSARPGDSVPLIMPGEGLKGAYEDTIGAQCSAVRGTREKNLTIQQASNYGRVDTNVAEKRDSKDFVTQRSTGQNLDRQSSETGEHGAQNLVAQNLVVQDLAWGYEASWTKSLIFNTKYETALKAEGINMWRDSLQDRRCIIPTLGFYESHRSETFINPRSGNKNKQQYLFTMPNTPLTFIAGIYENNRFSMLTTKPNAWVQPVHDRMPVVLRQEELFIWLDGDYGSLFDRESIELRVKKEQHGQDAVKRSQDTLRYDQDAQLPLW